MKRVKTKKSNPQHTFTVFTRNAYVFAICLCAMMVFTCAFVSSGSAYFERPRDVIDKSCGEDNTAGKKILVAYDTKYGSTATAPTETMDSGVIASAVGKYKEAVKSANPGADLSHITPEYYSQLLKKTPKNPTRGVWKAYKEAGGSV